MEKMKTNYEQDFKCFKTLFCLVMVFWGVIKCVEDGENNQFINKITIKY